MRWYSLPSITNINNNLVRFLYLNTKRHLAPAAPDLTVLLCAFFNEVGVAATRIDQLLFQFTVFSCQHLLVDKILALLVHKPARYRAIFLKIAIGQVSQRFVVECLVFVKRLPVS